MSYIITELHLEAAPFTVTKTGTIHAPLWAGVCGICNQPTPRRVLLGVVLGDMAEHMELHRLRLLEQAQELREIEAETARKKAAA